MASLTKFAGTVSQLTGGKFASFSNLNNVKNSTTGSWATTANIKGKSGSPNRPSTVSVSNFGFGLPTGAEVSKVIVTYRHKKTGKCSIGAPTISLLGVGGFSGKGVAPTTSLVTSTKNFSGSALTRSVVNSGSFGVKVDYPANSGSGEGTVSISYVKVTVEYKVPSYSLGLKKVSGGYNKEKYTLQATISNKNLTSYNPTLTLSAPVGFSFSSASGSGSYTKVNARTITWNPKLTNKVGTASLDLEFSVDVTYPSGSSSYSGTFSLSESLYGGLKSFTATITERPPTPSEDVDPYAPLPDGDTATVTELVQIDVIAGNDFKLDLEEIIGHLYDEIGFCYLTFYDADINMSYDGRYYGRDVLENYINYIFFGHSLPIPDIPIDGNWKITQPATYNVKFGYSLTGDFAHSFGVDFVINVLPEENSLSIPNFALLEPTEEELNRLGTGYPYVAEALMKHTTTDTNGRNWYKNNRIGVFNNAISDNITITTEEIDGEIVETITDSTDYDNLTDEEIFTYAEYWSTTTGGLNEYDNVECEFTYNSDYPLYIICTGDYPEAETYDYDMGTITYTEPNIIEKTVYNGREHNGNYPTPITALLDNEDISTLLLEPNQTAESIILYDFPVEQDFGTNEDYAIRGIQVRADIDSTDDLVVYAKLHNTNDEIGQRSTILTQGDTELVIGGLGDLWGFTTLQMTNLHEWELELNATNLLLNTESTLAYNNITITFYIETVDKQDIRVLIDGEDIAYYGAFIDKVEIPEGLETDTSFLTIDGTDTNDAYRQNIREKHITIEFNLSNCDLSTSTSMLRQLAKLFTNTRDQYNRPIPKRLQFTHYPTDYFEYIMEEPFDVDTETTDYNVKATLTIPAGTSYSLEDTVTNTVGNANGLAPLNPIIHIRPSDPNIQIRETLTGQTFQMGYNGDWSEHIVEIDCEDRRAYIIKDEDTKIDISKYVDHNSDWFRLSGEFEFEGLNCTVLTITFNERW